MYKVKGRIVMLAIGFLLLQPQAVAQLASIDGNEFYCVLEPNTQIEISAAVEGVLEEVKVQRGDRIKRGQVLATLISGVERATVELAEARVERQRAENLQALEKLHQAELAAAQARSRADGPLIRAHSIHLRFTENWARASARMVKLGMVCSTLPRHWEPRRASACS